MKDRHDDGPPPPAAVDNDDVGARGFELTTADEAGAKGPTRPGTRAAAGGECGAGVGLG
jgi:hypothetical protein